jgi:hypothetical protein
MPYKAILGGKGVKGVGRDEPLAKASSSEESRVDIPTPIFMKSAES